MTKFRIKPKEDLSNNDLNRIPGNIFQKKDLLKLKLNKNLINDIPKDIENLSRLETLDASNNRIIQLYSKLFTLSKLRILNLNNNKLINLPRQIGNLHNLRKLHLSNNRLNFLPKEFGDLKELVELNISYNKFQVFPKEILGLKKLKKIWIGGNHFSELQLAAIFDELPMLNSIYTFSNINYDKASDIDATYRKFSAIGGNNFQELKKGLDLKEHRKTEKTIFISYAHEDESWLTKLKPYLKVLQNEGLKINPWDDRRIAAGANWRDEIKNNLLNADAAILLISTSFLASDFIVKNELPPLLELSKKRGLKIYCVIVGHCRFTQHKELAGFQTINEPSQPLSSFNGQPHEVEKIFLELSNSISNDFT